MFKRITDFCAWLDTWLETNVGRPYNVLLSVGLVLEMVSKIRTLPATWTQTHLSIGTFLALAMEGALLINQLGEFSHRRHKRVARRAAKAAAATPALEAAPTGETPAPTAPRRLRRK